MQTNSVSGIKRKALKVPLHGFINYVLTGNFPGAIFLQINSGIKCLNSRIKLQS